MNTRVFLKRLIAAAVHRRERARPDRRVAKVIELCHALVLEAGEISGAALAREALAEYDSLSEAARETFFARLVSEFSPEPQQAIRAANHYRNQPSQANLLELRRAVASPREELFRRLNMAPGGTAALLMTRQRVLRALKWHPEWKAIDADLMSLFRSWFSGGFLALERIDWHTSAIVLEKLIRYEAVHEVASWNDLRRRVAADRCCFAFFHPALPREPIIFIEVALTEGISTAMQPLLDPDSPVSDPNSADSAIFYSISSCQEGLRGIPFGNLLIKQVAQQLRREFPRIKNFATLSPIPSFLAWLASVGNSFDATHRGQAVTETLKQLQDDDWFRGNDVAHLEAVLMSSCAYYLLYVKEGEQPADPVARFHLGNGAQIERLNWLADISKRGLNRSAGLMVNYVYRLGEVEDNHESYVKSHRVVASRHVRRLARDFLRRFKCEGSPPTVAVLSTPATHDQSSAIACANSSRAAISERAENPALQLNCSDMPGDRSRRINGRWPH